MSNPKVLDDPTWQIRRCAMHDTVAAMSNQTDQELTVHSRRGRQPITVSGPVVDQLSWLMRMVAQKVEDGYV